MLMDIDREPFAVAQGERRTGKRHATVLLIGKVTGNGADAACLVHDISQFGLMARFTTAAAVGDRMTFEVRGLAPFDATVRWVNGFKGGVEFDEPQDVSRVFCLRDAEGIVTRSPRFAMQAGAMLRLGDRRTTVGILDISAGGAKLHTDAVVQRGQAGQLLLPETDAAAFGSICWTRDDRFGFRFATPLPLATLSRVLGCCV